VLREALRPALLLGSLVRAAKDIVAITITIVGFLLLGAILLLLLGTITRLLLRRLVLVLRHLLLNVAAEASGG
jgi:hypothetical protein